MPRLAGHVLTVVAFLLSVATVRGGDLDLPPEKIEGGLPTGMMHRCLLRQAEHAAMRWKVDYEKRKTPEAIAAYQKSLRQKCLEALGGLPERTPLAPQVVGTVARPGYRVEKIIFESQPKHYVTAPAVPARGGTFQAAVSGRAYTLRSCRAGQGTPRVSIDGRPAGAERHGGARVRPDRPGRARPISRAGRLAQPCHHRRPHQPRHGLHPAGPQHGAL